MWQYQNTDELYHHGILGMKWGIRRYQNADGSLTPEGRKKADKLAEKYAKITGKHSTIKKNTAIPTTKKSISNMSNEELQKKVNRLRLEEQYRSMKLSNEKQNISKGKAFIQHTKASIGSGVQQGITEGTKNIIAGLLSQVGKTATNAALKKAGFNENNLVKSFDKLGEGFSTAAENIKLKRKS